MPADLRRTWDSFVGCLDRMAVLVLAGATLAACNQPPAVNPWRDDALPRSTWTTPSQDGVMAAGSESAIRRRDIPQTQAPRASDEVPHYSLWYEDHLEDKGDGNDEFAWTWQDYAGVPYCFGRFMVNTLALPVSAVVTPPGVVLVSDGNIGRWHDAELGHSPDPTAGPADFGFDTSGE